MNRCRLHDPLPAGGEAAMSTVAKVAWIDRYRLRLAALVPDLTPLDAASLAIDAYFAERTRRHASEPEEAAEANAAKRAAPRLTACLY
jgi:hypothetical protein